ncbi:uncharacterized protein PV07_08328 [Cladophialophora immunda]|uniref:FAD-binding PCMH-type domain-containing protein n=1 Tax=Cladophialophora immunda TaxID=569365 RepID=A0A0D2CC67_9EURO|nr:uncharacterized protein PV07_08328 [Cladophialophora immunda]KIW28688.1 hypothetical protein PV07_08328 [Cladophialophora immunda]OQV04446.1 FAD binding domain-containing protein [Cladophialophora immunda]
MRLSSGCLGAAFVLAVHAQSNSTDTVDPASVTVPDTTPLNSTDVVEPTDFNVTQALVDMGVNVSALPVAQLAERSSNAACSLACASLQLLYGSQNVDYSNEAAYNTFTSGYWSQIQENVDPYCIFKAPNTGAVTVVILLSRLTTCPFAVKSGGHAAFQGASNIPGGITVSLAALNTIKVSSDKKTVAVGPGNTWNAVYTALAPSNLAVIGGRVAPIGTGGLTTGGGISFFSSLYGWACDNVASYDVILASGIQVTASPTQNSDLYWALRGGGNNFGIVVNFNYEAISLPGAQLWGGTRVYLEDQFDALASAFAGVVEDSPNDGNAGQWVAWLASNGTKIASAELYYAKPNGGSAAIWNDYNALTAISDSTQNRQLPAYTAELASSNPYGLRETYYGLTVKADESLATLARDIFYQELPATANVAGANPVLIYQGITLPMIENMSKNGGNPLGISVSDGPLYLIHVACWWDNASDDATIYAFITSVLNQIKAAATSIGKQNDYIYMNYGGVYEDVIKSYGAANKAKLKSIASKYDPQQVFQILQPGYFKLDRAPVVDSRYFSG